MWLYYNDLYRATSFIKEVKRRAIYFKIVCCNGPVLSFYSRKKHLVPICRKVKRAPFYNLCLNYVTSILHKMIFLWKQMKTKRNVSELEKKFKNWQTLFFFAKTKQNRKFFWLKKFNLFLNHDQCLNTQNPWNSF